VQRHSAILVTDGADAGVCFVLDRPGPLTLGRDPSADLVLSDPTVSRQQANVFPEANGDVRVVACEAASPFLIGERRVREATAHVGERVAFGDVVLLVTDTLVAPARAASAGATTTNIESLLAGLVSEAEEPSSLYFLSDRLATSRDREEIEASIASWARVYAETDSVVVELDVEARTPQDSVVERSHGNGVSVELPVPGDPPARVIFHTRAARGGVTDSLRRRLLLAGALCGSALARVRAREAVVAGEAHVDERARAVESRTPTSCEPALSTAPADACPSSVGVRSPKVARVPTLPEPLAFLPSSDRTPPPPRSSPSTPRDSRPSPTSEPLARGVVIHALHESIRDFWGEEQLRRVVARLPSAIATATFGPEFQALAWYPVAHLEAWHEALHAGPAGGDDGVYVECMDRAIDVTVGRLRRVFMRLMTPGTLAVRGSELWRSFHTHGETSVEWKADTSARITLVDHPFVASRLGRLTFASMVRYTAALSRAKNVRQRHAFDGQGKLSVTLTWER
jgi:hypothetical protein